MTIQPFNDIPFHYGKVNRRMVVSGGIDTTAIDNFREGVSVRTTQDIYGSNQIKIFFCDPVTQPNGLATHEAPFVNSFGQPPLIVGTPTFTDSTLLIEGETSTNQIPRMVDYLISSDKPTTGSYKTYTNAGNGFREEAIIPSPTTHGNLENGSLSSVGNPEVEQMVFRRKNGYVRPFLEQDAWVLSTNNVISTGLTVSDKLIPEIVPWADEGEGNYFPELLGASDLVKGNEAYNPSDSFLQTRDKKSATAGYSYYGGNAAVYGTDSVAFGGLFRGS